MSVLQRLLAAARLVPRLLGALQRAARQLAAQLALTFFVPLCLTCLSLLGRIWVGALGPARARLPGGRGGDSSRTRP